MTSPQLPHPPFALAVFTLALSVTGLAPPALAQQEQLVLEEIIVTARKREERLMRVAQSVSAMGEAQIEAAFARDIRDLEGIAPNLVIDRIGAGPGVSALSIRGVTHQDVEKSFDPAVGVVLDGIYLGTNTGQELQVFDMQRIEVLRGPQGTLFGKNSIGGIINVTRTQPRAEFGGKIRGTYGDYDRTDLEAVVHFPIFTEQLAGKLTYVTRRQRDGFYDNVEKGTEEPEIDYEAYGINLLWTPATSFALEYTYDYQEDNTDTASTANFSQPDQLLCLLFARCAQGPTTPELGKEFKSNQNFSNNQFIELDAHTLEANWDITDSMTLTYLYGSRESEERTDQDFDSTAIDFFSTIREQDYEQQSHELRLTSDFDAPWDFVAGFYNWESEYQLDQQVLYLLTSIAGLPPGAKSTPMTDHETESWAVFFEVDFDFGERWSLTLGGRYTDEEKEMSRASEIDLFGDGTVILPDFSTYDDPGSGDWQEFTPKASLRYQLNDDHMFYLTYAEGFRSGGLNGRAGAPSSARATYDPEFVDMLEFGWKGALLDGRVLMTVAVFDQEYDDKQEEVVVPAPDSAQGQETITLNAASATMRGVELDVRAAVTDSWTLGFNYGYLDAEYDEFLHDFDLDGQPEDLSGLKLRRAPEFTFAFTSNYQWDMGPGVGAFQVAYRYKDDYETEFSNRSYGHVDAHGILDASLGYAVKGWEFRLFGRNLTDEDEVGAALDAGGLFGFAGWRDPRIWGLQASYAWGQ